MTPRIKVLKSLVGAVICGFVVSLATGVIENSTAASIIGAKYYGYPIVWRVTMTLQSDQFRFTDMAIDTAFWIVISILALTILQKISTRSLKKPASPSESAVSSSNTDTSA